MLPTPPSSTRTVILLPSSTLFAVDIDADLDPGVAQFVAAFAVEFKQKGHRASADARAAHADVDLFVEQDRHLVIDLGAGDVELGAAVVGPAVVYADRAPIFGDADIEIFQIAAVEHDALRVDLRIAEDRKSVV